MVWWCCATLKADRSPRGDLRSRERIISFKLQTTRSGRQKSSRGIPQKRSIDFRFIVKRALRATDSQYRHSYFCVEAMNSNVSYNYSPLDIYQRDIPSLDPVHKRAPQSELSSELLDSSSSDKTGELQDSPRMIRSWSSSR